MSLSRLFARLLDIKNAAISHRRRAACQLIFNFGRKKESEEICVINGDSHVCLFTAVKFKRSSHTRAPGNRADAEIVCLIIHLFQVGNGDTFRLLRCPVSFPITI